MKNKLFRFLIAQQKAIPQDFQSCKIPLDVTFLKQGCQSSVSSRRWGCVKMFSAPSPISRVAKIVGFRKNTKSTKFPCCQF